MDGWAWLFFVVPACAYLVFLFVMMFVKELESRRGVKVSVFDGTDWITVIEKTWVDMYFSLCMLGLIEGADVFDMSEEDARLLVKKVIITTYGEDNVSWEGKTL